MSKYAYWGVILNNYSLQFGGTWVDKLVWYTGKPYIVLCKYDSGFWEIRELDNKFKIELVHYLELEVGLEQDERE